jgi:hypothetical protein
MSAASALVGIVVLWVLGPHSQPGSADYWQRLVVFFSVVVCGLLCTRRLWDLPVSNESVPQAQRVESTDAFPPNRVASPHWHVDALAPKLRRSDRRQVGDFRLPARRRP